ncbi:DUF3592 domain-containing protein [Streptomyces sp. HUAS MG47]|uniref:DUF3592 domain-containing protein n=1 Tax=Streptomyces solicamelliae TaxID=3231716 RepID=UPI0038783858
MDVPGGNLLFFGFMAVLFGVFAASYGRRLLTVLRTLRRGVRTTGTCSRVEYPDRDSDAKDHYFVFRTADGREVEFKDLAGWTMSKGTQVTVAYDPADPERTATIASRDNWAPVRLGLVVVTGCGLACLLFLVLLFHELTG